MKRILCLLTLLCCFLACEPIDESKTHVRLNVCNGKYVRIQGRLMDAYSREGLSDANFEVTLRYYNSSDYFCWGCFTEVVGTTETDKDGYFDFKLPLDSMDLYYTYYISLQKNSYFGKEIIIDHFSKLDSLYQLSLYMNRMSTISLQYTNTINDTKDKILSYFYRVTPDSSLCEDDCPFGVWDDYSNANRFYVDASVRTFGTEQAIVTPSIVRTDCYIMHINTKELHYLINDTFPVAWKENISKNHVLNFPK